MLPEPASALQQPEATRHIPARWWDLLSYISGALGLMGVCGLLVRLLLPGVDLNGPATTTTLAVALGTNVLAFGGVVVLSGFVLGPLSPRAMGLWPVRIAPKWIIISLGAMVAVLPLRLAAGLLVQYLATGSWESAESARTELLMPQGPIWLNFLVSVGLGGILVPMAEELFFRGALYSWLRTRYQRVWLAVLVSSVVFALGHADQAAVVATSLVLGVVNALLYEYSNSIWSPILVHVANNSLAFVLLYGLKALSDLTG